MTALVIGGSIAGFLVGWAWGVKGAALFVCGWLLLLVAIGYLP